MRERFVVGLTLTEPVWGECPGGRPARGTLKQRVAFATPRVGCAPDHPFPGTARCQV
jgi:hypothetical protein